MSGPQAAAPSLRALYDSSLGPYLAAQDAQVRATRRNRWIILVVGLALSAATVRWVVRNDIETELPMAVAFGLAVGAVGLFFLLRDVLSDSVRDHVMAEIAPSLGLRFDARPADVDVARFEILGLADCTNVHCHDRLAGAPGGLAVDMMTAKLTDERTSGIGNDRQTRTSTRFTGVLMRLDDPAPPAVRFKLVPPRALSRDGMLRSSSITLTGDAAKAVTTEAEMLAMLEASAEGAPPTPTGDAAFDARFELHAAAPDLPAALARLDAGTRAALLEVAKMFGGGAVAVGFDAGGILLAFVTRQRFEIGKLRPPMAQFERVQHLADQMGILAEIADRFRTARASTAAPAP